MGKNQPHFTLTTLNPPLIFGPPAYAANPSQKVNTSNQFIYELAIQGKFVNQIPDQGLFIWVDVRDIALAHVRSLETSSAGGKRFIVVAGQYSNRQIFQIVRKTFPDLAIRMPQESAPGGDFPPEGVFKVDASPSRIILGLTYRPLENSVTDLVSSLLIEGTEVNRLCQE